MCILKKHFLFEEGDLAPSSFQLRFRALTLHHIHIALELLLNNNRHMSHYPIRHSVCHNRNLYHTSKCKFPKCLHLQDQI